MNVSKPSELLIVSWLALCIFNSYIIHEGWSSEAICYTFVGLFFNFVAIQIVISTGDSNEQFTEFQFKCPLVPFIPCLSIYVNTFLSMSVLMNKNDNTMLYFIVFEVIGILFYISYGLHNSLLEQRIEMDSHRRLKERDSLRLQ